MATTLATWTIDPVHSSVEFSLDYMGFSTYRTGLRALEGSLAIAFVFLFLPLVLRETPLSRKEASA